MGPFSTTRLLPTIIMVLAIPLALFLGKSVSSGSPKTVVMVIGVVFTAFLVLGIPQWLWMFAVGSVFIPGQLSMLPLPFKPMELILMLLTVRFIVEEIIFKKKWIRSGPTPDVFFIIGLFAVIAFHGYNDRFGMRVLGSEVWGGRTYITMLVGFLAYFVVQSTPLNVRLFRYLPTVVVLFGSIDFFINLIATLIPQSTYVLWNFYTHTSIGGNGAEFAERWGFLGNFGYLLLFWSLADCRIYEFLTKGRVFKAAIFLVGLAFCITCGYRSTVLIAALIIMLAAFRDFGIAGILGLIPIIIAFGLLVLLQSMGVELPSKIQRGLTFLPGTWDAAAKADAEGSNEFRSEIWALWSEIEFPKHPLLGRGFALHYEDMLATIPFTDEGSPLAAIAQGRGRNEAFVISGNIHNGFYSIIDRFGLVGCLLFCLWTFFALRRMFVYILRSRREPLNPCLQWLCLYILVFTVTFFPGALRAENFLPQQLFFTGLFLALYRITNKNEIVALARPEAEHS